MPSTYTSRLRLELQAAGENDDTWGARLNDSVISMLDEAVDGYLAKSVAGGSNVTLTSSNGASDESRQRVLKLTGTLTANIDVIVPAVEKFYVVWNATSGAFSLTFKPSGGTGLVIPQGYAAAVFTDGSTMIAVTPWFDPDGTGLLGGVLGAEKIYFSDDTWTADDDDRLRFIEVEVVGGGGSSAGTNTTGAGESSDSGGGGGGGYSRERVLAASLGAPRTVTVGSGGAAPSAGASGNAGGTSSFGAHLSATGGAAGANATAATSGNDTSLGGAGGAGSGGNVNTVGSDGGTARIIGAAQTWGNFGGGTVLGGSAAPTVAGKNYGGGGGGEHTGFNSAGKAGKAGADGIVIVREYY